MNATTMNDRPRTSWRDTPVSRIPDDDTGDPNRGRVGGVLAGISRAYGFDLHTTRIAMVIASIVLPVLILVYVAAWVLLPARPEEAVPIGDVLRDRRRMPILVAIGLVLLLGGLGSLGAWFFFRGVPWGLALVAVGVLLWVSTGIGRRTPPVAPPATGSTFAPPTGEPRTLPLTSPTASTTTASIPVVRRRRWPIGTVALAVAAVWVGFASLLEAAGAWNAPALWVIVAGLGIVVAGLAVSAAVNHTVLPLLPLLLVTAALTMLSIAQPRLDGGTGDRSLAPLTVAAATQPERLGTGQLTIDLRLLPAGADEVRVTAEVGIGRLHVIVPDDVTIRLATDLGAGVVQVDDTDITSGIRQDDARVIEPRTGSSTRTIVLDLRMGMGQIDVERR
jgi:phage shock protein PspC (stress-responsive transcriptional regulator)